MLVRLLLLLGVAASAGAQSLVDLTSVLPNREYALPADTLADPGGSLDWVSARDASGWQSRGDRKVESFGIENGARWFRTVLNRAPEDHRSLALVSWGTLLNHLDVVFLNADGAAQAVYRSGDAVQQDPRLPASLAFTFPLPDLPTVTVLVRIQTAGSMVFQMYLWERASLGRNLELQNLLLGYLFGFLSLMVLINVLFRFSLRDARFLWYALYVAALTFFLMVYSGWIRFLALPARFPQEFWDVASFALLLIAAPWFARKASRLTSVPGNQFYVWGMTAVSLGGWALGSLGWKNEGLLVLNGALVLMVVGCFGFIGYQAWRGDRFSRYFLVAWTMPLFSGFLISLQAIAPTQWEGPNPYYLLIGGIVVETLVLSFAFSDEIHHWHRTVQTRLDEAYRRDRLSALGLVAARLGHEINTPNHLIGLNLASLRSTVKMAADGGEPASDRLERLLAAVTEHTEVLTHASRQIGAVTEQLLTGQSWPADPPVRYDCAVATDQAVRLHATRWEAARARLLWAKPTRRFWIAGHPMRWEQLVVNLVDNAIQALTAPGQRVRIAIEAGDKDVSLVVADEGRGMDANQIARLGRPFATNRGREGGHGLGWGVCQEIVRDHRGELSVKSTPGEGTTIRVTVPRLS